MKKEQEHGGKICAVSVQRATYTLSYYSRDWCLMLSEQF